MKISLIATVLNAEEHVGAFLASIAAQTRTPDEIVIVDGGSTDGTVAALRAADGITLVEAPGANISRGRNVAIARAAHEGIAVADADCVYGPGWLAALVAPLEDGADVSMGWTEPIVESVLSACASSLGLPLSPTEVDPATFMPSARSVAFRRETIDAVGGYPEWLAIGEDMWVNHRWRERPFDLRFAPEAVAGWHPRDSLGAIWTQYVKYARGDGQAGMYPERHALRFAVYGGLLAGARLPPYLAEAARRRRRRRLRPHTGPSRAGPGDVAARSGDRHRADAGAAGLHRRREDDRLRARARRPAHRPGSALVDVEPFARLAAELPVAHQRPQRAVARRSAPRGRLAAAPRRCAGRCRARSDPTASAGPSGGRARAGSPCRCPRASRNRARRAGSRRTGRGSAAG